jgi:hypothetical protein
MKQIWGQVADQAEVEARLHCLERQTGAIIRELAALRSALNDLSVELEGAQGHGHAVSDPCAPGL